MKLILKILAAPFAVIFTLAYGFFKFVVMIGGTVLTIVAVLGAISAVILMFYAGFFDGLVFLIVAAIVFALPHLAALLVGAFGALNQALWGFIKS